MILLYIFVNKFSQLLKKKLNNRSTEVSSSFFYKKELLGYRCIAFTAIFPDIFALGFFTFIQAVVFPVPHVWLLTRMAFLGCRPEHSPFRPREGLEKTSGDFLPADLT